MKKIVTLIIFISAMAGLLGCDTSECDFTTVEPTDGKTFVCSNYTFVVSIPDTCQDGGCGLIVDVHGLFGSPVKQEANTHLRELGRTAVARGALTPYIVIQPKAPNDLTGWAAADYPFVQQFVEAAAAACQVDESRIHFTGFSQGGGMTAWMICNYSDYYASFAPVASGSDYLCFDDSENLPQTAILHMVGENDPWAWTGAQQYRDEILSAMEPYTETIISEGTGYSRLRYAGNGLQYDWLTHCGDHCMLGGDEATDACECECDIRHGDTVIDFFIHHPKGSGV